MRYDTLENLKNCLENDFPKLNDEIKMEVMQREQGDLGVQTKIREEQDRVTQAIEAERKGRAESEEEIVDMLKDMITKVRTELETEKDERNKNEDVLLGLLELASERSYGPGSPVGGADGVEDGASNALRSEALERYAAGFVVPTGRLDQTERASTSEFVTVDVARKLHGHLEDDVFHEGKVFLDQRRQLDIHRARAPAGLHPRSAGSDASSPLFVVALIHRPEAPRLPHEGFRQGRQQP